MMDLSIIAARKTDLGRLTSTANALRRLALQWPRILRRIVAATLDKLSRAAREPQGDYAIAVLVEASQVLNSTPRSRRAPRPES